MEKVFTTTPSMRSNTTIKFIRRDKSIAAASLAAIGIEHLASKTCTEISGGERQMVLFARVMAQQPTILLYANCSFMRSRLLQVFVYAAMPVCLQRAAVKPISRIIVGR